MYDIVLLGLNWGIGIIVMILFYKLFRRYGGRATRSGYGFGWILAGILISLIAISMADKVLGQIVMLIAILSWLTSTLLFIKFVR